MNRTVMVALSLALVILVEWFLYTLTVDATLKRVQKAQLEEVEQARIEERQLQENANREREQQAADLGAIAANLALDVERLRRERPTRPSVPPAPRTTCEGATGRELDADSAIFLRRSFALAAEQQIELNTCRTMYNQAMGLIKTK